MAVKKRELIEGAVVFGIGLMTLIEGIRLTVYKDAHSVEDIVGPGRYLIFLSVFMMLVGAIFFVSEFRSTKEKKVEAGNPSALSKTLPIIFALVVYIVLLYLIGYLGSTLVFFILMHRVMGFKSWTANIAVSAGIALALYGLFVMFLGMIFPRGILFS